MAKYIVDNKYALCYNTHGMKVPEEHLTVAVGFLYLSKGAKISFSPFNKMEGGGNNVYYIS